MSTGTLFDCRHVRHNPRFGAGVQPRVPRADVIDDFDLGHWAAYTIWLSEYWQWEPPLPPTGKSEQWYAGWRDGIKAAEMEMWAWGQPEQDRRTA